LRGENALKPRKWGAYDCDAEVLFTVTGQDPGRSYAEQPVQQSLDAQVMDWADDISYAVHDIEDFYRSGHIPLADYKPKSETLKRFLEYASKPEALGELEPEIISAFENLLTFMPKTAYAGTDEDHAVLDMVRSTMLTQFIDSTTLEQGVLRRDEVQDKLNALVKQLIWFHVIDGPRLASIQIGQQRIVRELFEVLAPVALTAYRVDDGDHPDDQLVRRLPYNLRVYIDRTRANSGPTYKLRECVYRGLADFISSLSDEDAYYQHSVLVGRPSHRHL
jgi:dGTPase